MGKLYFRRFLKWLRYFVVDLAFYATTVGILLVIWCVCFWR